MPVVTQSRLKTSLFKTACMIAEQTRTRITHTILEQSFGHDGLALIKKGGLVAIENLKSIIVPRNDDEVETEVVYHKAGQFHYWNGARWIDIDPNDLRQYELNMPWFLSWISEGLSLPRTAKPKEIVSGKAWLLGEMKIKRKALTIIFIRRLSDAGVLQNIKAHVQSFCRGKDVMAFTTTNGFAQSSEDSFRIVPLSAILTEANYLKFNTDSLFMDALAAPAQDGYGSGFRTARFQGNDYTFTKTQAAIVEALHEAGKSLHKSEFMVRHSKQDDPKGVFRPKGQKHPAWGKLILFDGKGNYWLAM